MQGYMLDIFRSFKRDYTKVKYIGETIAPITVDKSVAASNLATTKAYMASAYMGNNIIFAGGYNGTSSASVETYNLTLTKRALPNLPYITSYNTGASTPNYAFFAGGWSSGTLNRNFVYVYNNTLTRIANAPNLATARYRMCSAVSNYNRVYFIGGHYSSSSTVITTTVDTYNSNTLTRTTAPALNTKKLTTACDVGDYVIVAGGSNVGYSSVNGEVEAYNRSIVKTKLPNLPKNISFSVYNSTNYKNQNGYAIFAGGTLLSSAENLTTYAYDSNLVRSQLDDVSRGWAKQNVNLPDRLVSVSCSSSINEVDSYDKNLTHEVLEPIITRRLGGAVNKHDANILVAGGYTGSAYVNTVETYEIGGIVLDNITLPVDSSYSYDDKEYTVVKTQVTVPVQSQKTLYVKYKENSVINI